MGSEMCIRDSPWGCIMSFKFQTQTGTLGAITNSTNTSIRNNKQSHGSQGEERLRVATKRACSQTQSANPSSVSHKQFKLGTCMPVETHRIVQTNVSKVNNQKGRGAARLELRIYKVTDQACDLWGKFEGSSAAL